MLRNTKITKLLVCVYEKQNINFIFFFFSPPQSEVPIIIYAINTQISVQVLIIGFGGASVNFTLTNSSLTGKQKFYLFTGKCKSWKPKAAIFQHKKKIQYYNLFVAQKQFKVLGDYG